MPVADPGTERIRGRGVPIPALDFVLAGMTERTSGEPCTPCPAPYSDLNSVHTSFQSSISWFTGVWRM